MFGAGAPVAVLVPRTSRKASDLPRPSDPIETDQGSDSIHTCAQAPEILNIPNWPVESRRGAPVERWRGHGFRRPAPSHLCLDTPLQLRFLSPLIEPSVRISRTGLSFEIMRSHTRSRAVRPVRRSRPLCDRPPGKRTSSRTPPRASAPATDATAVSPAPVLPTAAARPPGTRFTSACYVELHITCGSTGCCTRSDEPARGGCRSLSPAAVVPGSRASSSGCRSTAGPPQRRKAVAARDRDARRGMDPVAIAADSQAGDPGGRDQ